MHPAEGLGDSSLLFSSMISQTSAPNFIREHLLQQPHTHSYMPEQLCTGAEGLQPCRCVCVQVLVWPWSDSAHPSWQGITRPCVLLGPAYSTLHTGAFPSSSVVGIAPSSARHRYMLLRVFWEAHECRNHATKMQHDALNQGSQERCGKPNGAGGCLRHRNLCSENLTA